MISEEKNRADDVNIPRLLRMAADAIIMRHGHGIGISQRPSAISPAEVAWILNGLAKGYEDLERQINVVDSDPRLGDFK